MFLVCLLAFVLALAAFVVGLLEGASDIRYTVISFIYLFIFTYPAFSVYSEIISCS